MLKRNSLQSLVVGAASFIGTMLMDSDVTFAQQYPDVKKENTEQNWLQTFLDSVTPQKISFTSVCHHWSGPVAVLNREHMYTVYGTSKDMTKEDVYAQRTQQLLNTVEGYANFLKDPYDPDQDINQYIHQGIDFNNHMSGLDYEDLIKKVRNQYEKAKEDLQTFQNVIDGDNGQYVLEVEEQTASGGETEYIYRIIDEDKVRYNERANFGILMNYNLGQVNENNNLGLQVGVFRNSFYRWAYTASLGWQHDFKKLDGFGVSVYAGIASGYKRNEVADFVELDDNHVLMGGVELNYDFPNSPISFSVIATPDFISPTIGLRLGDFKKNKKDILHDKSRDKNFSASHIANDKANQMNIMP